jgi:hypothetical protein
MATSSPRFNKVDILTPLFSAKAFNRALSDAETLMDSVSCMTHW